MASYESKIKGYVPKYNPNLTVGEELTINTAPIITNTPKRLQRGGEIEYITTKDRFPVSSFTKSENSKTSLPLPIPATIHLASNSGSTTTAPSTSSTGPSGVVEEVSLMAGPDKITLLTGVKDTDLTLFDGSVETSPKGKSIYIPNSIKDQITPEYITAILKDLDSGKSWTGSYGKFENNKFIQASPDKDAEWLYFGDGQYRNINTGEQRTGKIISNWKSTGPSVIVSADQLLSNDNIQDAELKPVYTGNATISTKLKPIQQAYVQRMFDASYRELKKLGFSDERATKLARMTASQFAHETGYGKNSHSRDHYNHGSIHADANTLGAYLSKDGGVPTYFRSFNSDDDFFNYFFNKFLNLPRYRGALDVDPEEYFDWISDKGYKGVSPEDALAYKKSMRSTYNRIWTPVQSNRRGGSLPSVLEIRAIFNK